MAAYFTVSEARTVSPLNDTGRYSDAAIDAARVDAEGAIEDACHVAFVPRSATETVSPPRPAHGYSLETGVWLALRWPLVRAVTSVTVDGTALDLNEVVIVPSGLYVHTPVRSGVRNVTVTYDHGYSAPPARIRRAAIRLAKHYLVDSPVDDRALRVDSDDGSYLMAQPGVRGARFGIPEVDSAVADYTQPMGVW